MFKDSPEGQTQYEPAAPEPLGDSEGTATQVVAGLEQQFAKWMRREMPAGTVIGDPDWWVPRILKAATVERLVQERDDYRAALEICKTEMQGDKWDALYIDTVLAKYHREDAIEQASRLV